MTCQIHLVSTGLPLMLEKLEKLEKGLFLTFMLEKLENHVFSAVICWKNWKKYFQYKVELCWIINLSAFLAV